MPIHPDVLDLVHGLIALARKEAYGDGATDGYTQGFADCQQQTLKDQPPAAAQSPINGKDYVPSPASTVWPTSEPENPYNPSRPLCEAFPYLEGIDSLLLEELTNRFERRDQGAATILILQRTGIEAIEQLIGYSEERILSDEFPGIGQLRMDLLKGALQKLNDEVAENSH